MNNYQSSVGAVAAGTYYEADDPASYPGGVLPSALAASVTTPEDVKKAQTRGILYGLGAGLLGAAVLYYAARKGSR